MVQKPYLVAHQVTRIMKQTILIKVRAYKKNNHIHMPGMQRNIFLAKQRGWEKGADYGESPGGLQDLS